MSVLGAPLLQAACDSLGFHCRSGVCSADACAGPAACLTRPPLRQVKRNLMNVSYRIAQYTDVISRLRREIEHLKSRIERKSGPAAQDVQGRPGGPALSARRPPWRPCLCWQSRQQVYSSKDVPSAPRG